MKNIAIIALLMIGFTGCKKIIESAQEDLVIQAMTDGQWKVTSFKRDSTDVTTSFSSYSFQFNADKTVHAINNGSVESKGTWNADANQRTIVSTFPNANATIQLLNGTWKITKNSWTYVEANQSVNNEVRTLRLDK